MNQPTKNDDRHLLLLDGHALAFHSWFTDASVASGFFSLLNSAIDKYRPTHVAVAFDPPPPTFRHHLYPEYKANRPPVPADFLEECAGVEERLDKDKTYRVSCPGYEADDVIGTLARQADQMGLEVTILTCDLDLLQLVSDSVCVEVFSQYWPTRVFGIPEVVARFQGLSPSAIPDYKALAGDRSDNLPGVPGIGDKAATALLQEYRSISGIYEGIESVSDLKVRGARRLQRLLIEYQEQAYTMLQLTTIVRSGEIEQWCDLRTSIDLMSR